MKKEILQSENDTLRFMSSDSFLDRTPLTLSTVGGGTDEAEAEGVGRRVGAAANSGEWTRTSRAPATGRGELARASRTSSSSRSSPDELEENSQKDTEEPEYSVTWRHLEGSPSC